ncbi:hypothetical protein AN219_09945 [Streptomyces nanshensis]|nr:hypothetical protein AN219_09945 [Streptomyces nanshensis]
MPGDSFQADPVPGVTAPGYTRPQDVQGAQEARQWQDRINKVLQEAATIDENAATRLRHNFQDDDDGSQFRGDAFAGGKTDAGADAGRASQLARKGEDMSLSEINELNALMKEHGKDPAFSAKFATSMGGQGTIDFWHGMRPDAVNPNDPRHKAIEQMRGNLGRTLATATGSGAPGMDKWKRDVIAAGDERQGNGSNTDPYGFQVMSDLMQEGEWDGQFLGDYGKEVLSFEREAIEDGKSPEELWTGHDSTPSNYDLPGNSWGNDPVTGLLTGVSHNPDAATDLFNDKTLFKDTSAYVDQGMVNMPWAEDEKESYSTAEYLLNHRQYFDTIDSVDGKTVNPSMDALGDAMFAASSGRTPGDTTSPYLDPTPDQLEATRNSLHGLAENDKFPPELRDDASKVLAHHGQSTYDTMSSPRTMETPFDRADLAKVTTEVAHDGAAFGTLDKSLNEIAVHDIQTEKDDPAQSLDRSGRVNGFLEYSATSALNDDEEGKIDQAAWNKSAAGAVAGGGLGYVPVAGGAASAVVGPIGDAIAKDYEDGVKEATEGERQKISEARSERMNALVETWQRNNGNWAAEQPSGFGYDQVHQRISEKANDAQQEAKQSEGKK